MHAYLGTCLVFKVIIAVVTQEAIKKKAIINAAIGRKLRRKIGYVTFTMIAFEPIFFSA
jgi:hypothetical protein